MIWVECWQISFQWNECSSIHRHCLPACIYVGCIHTPCCSCAVSCLQAASTTLPASAHRNALKQPSIYVVSSQHTCLHGHLTTTYLTHCVFTSPSCSTWICSFVCKTPTLSSGNSTVKPLISVNSCLISPPESLAFDFALLSSSGEAFSFSVTCLMD
jgi:hypothetical protein